jgi:hypothetical protein
MDDGEAVRIRLAMQSRRSAERSAPCFLRQSRSLLLGVFPNGAHPLVESSWPLTVIVMTV